MSASLLLALALAAADAGECTAPAGTPTEVAYGTSDIVGFAFSRETVHATKDGEVLWTLELPDIVPGEVRAMRFDANGDGRIEEGAGDRVWIFFGARNAARYFALDVTDPERPQLLWEVGAEELPGLGQAWSAPTLARVRILDAEQNGEKIVIVAGGGYAVEDELLGRALFIIDAQSGRLLWSAGSHPDADLMHDAMRYAIPSRVGVLDTDADGFVDRLYVGDLGGQLWRFDVANGRARRELITGGVLASLGAADPEAVLPADARQFFNAPDIALIQPRGAPPFYNLAIGSGDRANAGTAQTQDRFYSIRDRWPAGEVASLTPIRDRDLVELAADRPVPLEAPGWKLSLGAGEKVLRESLTADGTILATTHQPDGACGTNRIYVLRVESGQAALDLNRDGEVTPADLSQPLAQSGMAGDLRITLNPSAPGSSGEEPPPTSTCYAGDERLGDCPRIDRMQRTFWYRRGTD